MNRNLAVAVGILVLIALVAGFFYLKNKSSGPATSTVAPTIQPTPTKTPSTSPSASASPSAGAAMKEESANITVNQDGFSPATLNIKVGTKATWTNKSGGPVAVNSDTHPTHTLWPFLNLGQISDSQSVSVVFDKAGTYTYHNHLTPSQKGTVIVQ